MNFDDLFYSMKSRYLSFLRCLIEKIINKMDIQIVCVIFKVAKKIIKVRKVLGTGLNKILVNSKELRKRVSRKTASVGERDEKGPRTVGWY